MQIFVKRSYQGRLRQEVDSLGPQYSPKHTSSHTITKTTVTSESYTGGKTKATELTGYKNVDVPDGMGVTFSKIKTDFTHKEAVDSFAAE
jgi:hypothetical protein